MRDLWFVSATAATVAVCYAVAGLAYLAACFVIYAAYGMGAVAFRRSISNCKS